MTRIRDLFVANVSELYGVEEEILRQLPLMSAHASGPALREFFDQHYRETYEHRSRLETILDSLDERRRATPPHGIRSLVEEARLRQAFIERGDLLDLTLIDAGRRIEHYEMAAYSSTLGYARRLEFADAAALLTETLDEEQRADHRLNSLTSPARASAA